MSISFLQWAGLAFLFAMSYLLVSYRKQQKRLPLPPGPKRLPIIGNLLDAPETREWLTYAEWSRQYGEHEH
jgi:hypothetical protein